MRSSLFQIRSRLAADLGSSTIGFVLIVPLLVSVFFAVLQIANLVNTQTVLQSAANSAARIASRFDGSLTDGQILASQQLDQQGINSDRQVQISHQTVNGLVIAQVQVIHDYKIPWVGVTLHLQATGRAVDEKFLN